MHTFQPTLIPDNDEFKNPQHLQFVTDFINNPTPLSPFSIHYYIHKDQVPSPSHIISYQIQLDGGANRSITPCQDLLLRYKPTNSYPIYGVNKEDVALNCVGHGYLPWIADNGDVLYIPTFYSPDAAETIISPTDVVLSHNHIFCAWAQFSHCTTGQGHVTFYRTEGTNHTTYPLTMRNGLWYHDAPAPQPPHGTDPPGTSSSPTTHLVISRLNARCLFELWHHRLIHCCIQTLYKAHKHIKGVPKLKGNPFFRCASCLHAKPK
jgi:hypothetical protein